MRTGDQKTLVRRILMIAPTPFFADRGCHVRILEEARALIAGGHRVTICTYHIGRDIDGIETRRIIRIPWYSKLSAGPSIHKFYLDLLLFWTVLCTCLKSRPDIIHAHLHEGVVVGKVASLLFGVPLVADLQGSLTAELVQHHFIEPRGLFYRIFQWAESVIVRMPDVTITSSATALCGSPDGLPEALGKTEVIIGSVDTERFYPDYPSDGIRDKLGVPPGVKIIGFLGLLTDYQGVSVLLEAVPHVVKAMQRVHFLIMGYPNVEHYREKAKTLGIEDYVIFTGRVAYQNAPKYLAICDVAVSPKFATTEGNGKLLNYMALGLPVVASETPVNRLILGDLGIYAEVGDPISLANALLMVLSDDGYAQKLQAPLSEKALAEYSQQSIGKRLSGVYEHVIMNGRLKPDRARGVGET